MIKLLTTTSTVTIKVAIETFTGWALLGDTLYTASRANKVVRTRSKSKNRKERHEKNFSCRHFFFMYNIL